jgi:hypothetical protein
MSEERLTLRQADQAREDFASITEDRGPRFHQVPALTAADPSGTRVATALRHARQRGYRYPMDRAFPPRLPLG